MSAEPDDRSLRLNAALDGELDPMGARAFERDIEADPDLAAEYRRLQSLREAVRRHAPRERAPPGLVDRVTALAHSPASAPRPPRLPSTTARWTDVRTLALAASFALLGFVLGAGIMTLRTQGVRPDAAHALVSDFAAGAIGGQPFDVASSDRHTVKPWLAGRTTVSANIVDLAAQGFPLAGGRVAVVDRVPAPTLVYRHHEHMIAVTELPPRGAATGPSFETIDGYHVARFADANLAYIAVTDADETALAEFVNAFRAAEAPATEGKP